MTEHDLVQAILAAPDDDGPRLVYADWLTARGDPRGEYVALSVKAHRVRERHEVDHELEAAADAILDRFPEWLELPGGATAHWSITRGLVERVAIDGRAWLAASDEIQRAAPHLRRLILTGRPVDARALATSIAGLPLETLWLEPMEGLERIFRSEARARLHKLAFLSEPPAGLGAAMAAAPTLAGLRGLQIFGGGGDLVRELAAAADALPSLESLHFSWPAGDLDPVLAWPRLRQLRELEVPAGDLSRVWAAPLDAIRQITLRSDGALPMTPPPWAAQLRQLDVRARVTDDDAAVIAGWPLERIASLGLWEISAGRSGFDALASSPALAAVRGLGLGWVGSPGTGDPELVRRIVDRPTWAGLRYLTLQASVDFPPAGDALATATVPLEYLALDRIGAGAIARIATAFPGLRSLSLKRVALDEREAALLASLPLRELRLESDGLPPATIDALRARFGRGFHHR
jgi:uncharacterized protein (TIGR02996 family)